MSCKYFYPRKKVCAYDYFKKAGIVKPTKCEGKKKKCKNGKWEEAK